MDIKRFIGPDMRSALRLVREQLGPDAVILARAERLDAHAHAVSLRLEQLGPKQGNTERGT